MAGVSSASGTMGGTPERRGTWGRAISRLKDVFKRRSSSSKSAIPTPSKLTAEEPIKAAPSPSAAVETTNSLAAEPPKPVGNTSDVPPAHDTPATSMDAPLVAETGEIIEVDDTAESSLPMITTRTAITNERAHKLFEKYGLKYEPRSTSTEVGSLDEIRRVEKPIRIRIHWTCHDCNASFGCTKTCTSCGHWRCRQCPRSPAKRVREMLETTRQQQEQEEQSLAAPSEQEGIEGVPTVTGTPNDSSNVIVSDHPQPARLEVDDIQVEEESDLSENQYVVQQGPRSGIQLVLRPKTQIARRTCHECQTHFTPANRTECQNCGHIRCNLCKRHPVKRESTEDDSQAKEEPQMVRTVQRVYKKPRQRVRWTCDQCQATFVTRERCRSCGHERCRACARDP